MVWTTSGTPAARAANRPTIPALELCVCTTSYRSVRNSFFRWRNALRSESGAISRTNHGHSTIFSPGHETRFSSSPSGPGDGPVTSVTSCPASRAPRQESSVFSCAPPTIIRVMTWQIFIPLHRLNARCAISFRYCIPVHEIFETASYAFFTAS